ncbi:unnamed protein product [Schistosoma spindalis]|nr:unnamed protein product [Schistosoma spindale]
MDSEINQSNVQDIIQLIKQSNNDIKSFQLLYEKLTNSISINELNDFLEILINHLHELQINTIKKLLLDNINLLHWINYNDSIIYKNIINLYITCITYYPNLIYNLCDFYINHIFYLKHIINEQLNYQYLNQFINFSLEFFISIYQLLPIQSMNIDLLIDLLIKQFPNWRKSIKQLFWSTYHIIYILCHKKLLNLLTNIHKCNLLSILFHIIIEIELNPNGINSNENILKLFENTSIYTLFEKFDQTILEIHLNNFFHTIDHIDLMISDKNWFKLELISWLLITHMNSIVFIKTNNNNNSSIELNWNLLCIIFRYIRDLFSEHILPVNMYLIGYPIICFYICSLRGGLIINFIDFLWNIIKNNQRDENSRLMALNYLCFILINGKFCYIELIIEIMHDLATWCIDYTYRNRIHLIHCHSTNLSLLLLSQNKIYYAICNVLIYIFVQLHSELLNEQYLDSCNRLPIGQILLSPYKPLLYIPIELRHIFFYIISKYQLNWSMISLTQLIYEKQTDIIIIIIMIYH